MIVFRDWPTVNAAFMFLNFSYAVSAHKGELYILQCFVLYCDENWAFPALYIHDSAVATVTHWEPKEEQYKVAS